MGIHFNKVIFYGMNKNKFKELVKKGKIKNKESKNKDSKQCIRFINIIQM